MLFEIKLIYFFCLFCLKFTPSSSSCSYTCKTCDTRDDDCATCSGNKHRVKVYKGKYNVLFNLYHCDCDTNYYDDGLDHELCLYSFCHPSWFYFIKNNLQSLTCYESTEAECASCDLSKFLILENQKCICQDKYYNNDTINIECDKCHYSCKTCINGNTQTNCKTCESSKNRNYNSSTGECLCDVGFYDDLKNEQCGTCHHSCKTCEVANTEINCKTCESSKHRSYQSITGKCLCEEGFYDDISNEVCKICHYSCSHKIGDYNSCNEYNSKFNCTKCDDTKFRKLISTAPAQCVCEMGWCDTGVEECKQCHYSCSHNHYDSCVQQTKENCTQCDNNKHRILLDDFSPSECICDVGWYDDGENELCKQIQQDCHYSCFHNNSDENLNSDSCDSNEYNHCLKCNSSKHRVLKSLITPTECICENGWYDDGINEECQLEENYNSYSFDGSLYFQIYHTYSINCLNFFEIQTNQPENESNYLQNQEIDNVLILIQQNWFQYIDFIFRKNMNTFSVISPSLQQQNREITADFTQIMQSDQQIESIQLESKKKSDIQIQDNTNQSLILANASFIFTYIDLNDSISYNSLDIEIGDQNFIENEKCELGFLVSYTKTENIDKLVINFEARKSSSNLDLSYLNINTLQIIASLSFQSINFEYLWSLKEEQNNYKQFSLSLTFESSFTDPSNLIITFSADIFSSYCNISFIPTELPIIFDNYYKTSEEQKEVAQAVSSTIQSTQSTIEATTGMLAVLPSGVILATSSYQMNQLIFISLIPVKRPSNMVSAKKQTGLVIPQLNFLHITEAYQDKENQIGMFLQKEYPCYCLNIFSLSLIVLFLIMVLGNLFVQSWYNKKQMRQLHQNLQNLKSNSQQLKHKLKLQTKKQILLQFLIWKSFIICYFLSTVGISLFCWTNMRFSTLYTVYGFLNFLVAILVKCLQLAFYYFLGSLIYLKYLKYNKRYQPTQKISNKLQKFNIFYKQFSSQFLHQKIYPLQEVIKIELLSLNVVFLQNYPILQTILLILIMIGNFINYLHNSPFENQFKRTLTILNDSLIQIQCVIFYQLFLISDEQQDDIYQLGNIFYFSIILHKLLASAFSIFVAIQSVELISFENSIDSKIENLKKTFVQLFEFSEEMLKQIDINYQMISIDN